MALQPASADARYNLGLALWYSGSKDKALEALRESVRLDPAAGAAQAFLGVALRDHGDLPGARASLQRADRAAAADGGGLRRSRQRLLPFQRDREGDRAVRGRPERAAAGAAGAGLEHRHRRFPTAMPKAGAPAEAHHALGLLLGRNGGDSAEVVAAFREALRLRPEYPEAQNHLGLVLVQLDDDAAGIAAFRGSHPARARLRRRPHQPRRGPDADRRRRRDQGAGGRRRARAVVGQGPLQPRGGLRGQPEPRSGQGDRGAAPGPAARAVVRRAHVALGKALLQSGQVAPAVDALAGGGAAGARKRGSQLPAWTGARPRGEEGRGRRALARGRELVAAADRDQSIALDSRGRARGDDTGRARPRRDPVPARRPAAARGCRGAAPARHGPRSQGGHRRRRRRVSKGRGAESGRHRVDGRRHAADRHDDEHAQHDQHVGPGQYDQHGEPRRRCRARGAGRGLHPRRQVRRGRAAADRVREDAPLVVVGLVRARLQPVRAAEDRRGDQGAGDVAAARSAQRRGAQDPRAHDDDHRPLRRGADRVRGRPARQAGFGRAPLQPRQARLDPGRLADGTLVVRGGAAHRPRLPRGDRRARVRAGSARRRSGRGGALPEGHRLERRAQGHVRLGAREPERLLQPHRPAGQGDRAGQGGHRARSEVRIGRGSRRRGPTSARDGSPTPCPR